MNCLKCELRRARIKARLLYSVGWTLEAIAAKLSKDYGELYYVRVYHRETSDLWGIQRLNKLPPFNHFEILKKDLMK